MDKERLAFARGLALEAGRLTLKGFGRSRQMPKGGAEGYDIATEYDLRAEDLIKSRILHEFGEPVLGEEDGLHGDVETARHSLWIVDPIDGTFNYQRGLPLYAISIAFCQEGVPACAVVALPALDHLFFASRGTGAYVVEGNGAPPLRLRASREREIDRLVIGLAGKDTYRLLAACEGLGIPWRSVRLWLAAVPSLAYVAWGRLHAFVDTSLKPWDCASGDLLLQEAGGPPLVDHRGVPLFPDIVRRWLAGNEANFVCVGAASRHLWREPLFRLLVAAGLAAQEPAVPD